MARIVKEVAQCTLPLKPWEERMQEALRTMGVGFYSRRDVVLELRVLLEYRGLIDSSVLLGIRLHSPHGAWETGGDSICVARCTRRGRGVERTCADTHDYCSDNAYCAASKELFEHRRHSYDFRVCVCT